MVTKFETMVGMFFGFARRIEEKNLSFDVSKFIIFFKKYRWVS